MDIQRERRQFLSPIALFVVTAEFSSAFMLTQMIKDTVNRIDIACLMEVNPKTWDVLTPA